VGRTNHFAISHAGCAIGHMLKQRETKKASAK